MRPTSCGEILLRRGNYLVRRLPPGHATPWHRDPFHRVTVALSGDMLDLRAETERSTITVGEAHWLEPSDRVHRAVNVGAETFEEVTTFFLDRPDAPHQPELEVT